MQSLYFLFNGIVFSCKLFIDPEFSANLIYDAYESYLPDGTYCDQMNDFFAVTNYPNYFHIITEDERALLILIAIRKGLYQSVSRLKLLTVLLSVFSCGIWHLEVGKVVAAMALLQKLKPHIHQHRLQISMKPGQSRTRDWLMSSFKKSYSRLFFFQKLNQKSRY